MSQNHAATQHSQLTHGKLAHCHIIIGHAGQCQTVIFELPESARDGTTTGEAVPRNIPAMLASPNNDTVL